MSKKGVLTELYPPHCQKCLGECDMREDHKGEVMWRCKTCHSVGEATIHEQVAFAQSGESLCRGLLVLAKLQREAGYEMTAATIREAVRRLRSFGEEQFR